MNYFLWLLRSSFALMFPFLSIGVSAKVDIDPNQASGNHLAYPVPDRGIPQLTPAPEGYIPFHMEHYGRHGSRWRLGKNEYGDLVKYLNKAHNARKLTPKGEEIFKLARRFEKDSQGHLGELTNVGKRQHRGIANRMMTNFPEIFNDTTLLDAKSTESVRCILSMANEIAEFQSVHPNMPLKMDATQEYQDILNYNSKDPIIKTLRSGAAPAVTAYRNSLPKPSAVFDKLFTDRQFVKKEIGEDKLFKALFDLANNVQSHDGYPSMWDIFTPDEIYNEWLARNANWYIASGHTPLTKDRVPYSQRVLLRNIIESADTAMMSQRVSANLRFGHDLMLSPLAALMELDKAGYSTSDLSTLADNGWHDFEISPMAANIQIIFYRPLHGDYNLEDVLVKVLLNEKETTLPVAPVAGKYYRWTELRDFYLKKLANMPKVG